MKKLKKSNINDSCILTMGGRSELESKSLIVQSVLVLLLLAGCDSRSDYVECKLISKNPTSYEFEASLDSIKSTIHYVFGKGKYAYLESADDYPLVSGKGILDKSENKQDFVLENLFPGHKSKVYVSKKEIVPYFYKLHLHLTTRDSSKTLVKILTINPRISIGVRFPYNILPFTLPGAALIKPVSPSTIEEYEVLLLIGDALGIRQKMAPLQLPFPLE